MHREIFALAAVLAFSALPMFGCGGTQTVSAEAVEIPRFAPGMKLRYIYQSTFRNATYEVEIVDDTHLYWEAVTGPSTGMHSGVEYTIREIAPGVVFLSWVEGNGNVVAQVVDLVHLEVHAVESSGDSQRLQVDGRIEVIRESR